MITNWQKFFGLILYFLPWSEVLVFGRYLIQGNQYLEYLSYPAILVLILKSSIPFGGLIVFLCIFLFIIRNNSMSYFIKFNALQSVLLSIIISIVNYGFQIFIRPINNLFLISTISSLIFVSTLAIISFCLWQCFQGEEADIPLISEAVRMQI